MSSPAIQASAMRPPATPSPATQPALEQAPSTGSLVKAAPCFPARKRPSRRKARVHFEGLPPRRHKRWPKARTRWSPPWWRAHVERRPRHCALPWRCSPQGPGAISNGSRPSPPTAHPTPDVLGFRPSLSPCSSRGVFATARLRVERRTDGPASSDVLGPVGRAERRHRPAASRRRPRRSLTPAPLYARRCSPVRRG